MKKGLVFFVVFFIGSFFTLADDVLLPMQVPDEQRVQNILSSEDKESVIATVNGEEVVFSEILVFYKNMLQNHLSIYGDQKPLTDEYINRYRRESLDKIIKQKMLLQEIRRKQFEPSESELDEAFQLFLKGNKLDTDEHYQGFLNLIGMTDEQVKKDLYFKTGVKKLFEEWEKPAMKPTEEEVKSFYEKNPSIFQTPKQVEYSIIQLNHPSGATPENNKNAQLIQKIRLDILSGKKDFEWYASNFSDHLTSRKNGGSLGLMTEEQLFRAFPFFQNVKVEDMMILNHPDFYLLVKIKQIQEPEVIPFEKVKDSIVSNLWFQRKNMLRNEHLQKMMNESKIEIKGKE